MLTTQEAADWRAVLPADVCVMGCVEYVRIVERQTKCAARLFVVESAETVIVYPFFLRPVHTLPFASKLGKVLWDTFTPEYTGPLRLGPAPLREPSEPGFPELFARHCREQGIVTEFAHLSPWNQPAHLFDPTCIETDRLVVYLDLALGEEGVWTRSLTSDTRRMTKKAQLTGVRIRRAQSVDDVRQFHRLYRLTMQRRQALERYLFPLEYFLAFFETMPENSFFVLAEYQERPVAGGLYLHGGTDLYWHLSATDLEFAHVRPVNAYLWETIRWGLRHGKKRMLMGGGYEPDDGVFRFKVGYSPLRARFCTYKRIHDAEIYAALTKAWSMHHKGCTPRTRYFPAYRAEWITEQAERKGFPRDVHQTFNPRP